MGDKQTHEAMLLFPRLIMLSHDPLLAPSLSKSESSVEIEG